ncbi:hypothetical protein ACFU98_06105 [Streptomyces sp. NPDC057575]|uniref:hypothetical protein n=1 Tax=unclassified Streptomyces TaxID=2593676 RepID=UPI0036AED5B2
MRKAVAGRVVSGRRDESVPRANGAVRSNQDRARISVEKKPCDDKHDKKCEPKPKPCHDKHDKKRKPKPKPKPKPCHGKNICHVK